jgi:hypothetical protein
MSSDEAEIEVNEKEEQVEEEEEDEVTDLSNRCVAWHGHW